MNTTKSFQAASLLMGFSFVFLAHCAKAQSSSRDPAAPFGKIGKALTVFSVDETASKAGKATQPNGQTIVAGPIEFHLPRAPKPAWMELISNRTPIDKSTPTTHHPPAHAQAIHAQAIHAQAIHAQAAHRTVGHARHPHPHVSPHYEYESVDSEFDPRLGMVAAGPSHHVIRSPGYSRESNPSMRGPQHGIHQKAGELHEQHEKTHPELSSIHRRVQPEPPSIPGGREQELWKQPYSYGYFGASGDRHWSMQYGYRDRYTQWTRR